MFTEQELAYCQARANAAQHFAARFAAKEAVYKALGGDAGIGWRDIGVVSTGKQPRVALEGRAAVLARQHSLQRIHLSLSHSDTVAVAFVVAEQP